MANDLGAQLNALNQRLQKAGQQPLNTKSILNGIANQVSRGKTANIGATTAGKGIKREGFDPANTQVQPLKEDDEELEGGEEDQDSFVKSGDKPLTGFAPSAQSLGVATVKPDGAPTSGLDINISPDKSVNISMNESERKLRKYIRNRLEENAGKRKPSLNENQKSSTLKKLDAVIDKQFKLYENVVVKKNKGEVNEIFGFSAKEKIAKLQQNDIQGIENIFNSVFQEILNNPNYGIVRRTAEITPPETKFNILKQYAQAGDGTLRVAPDRRSVVFQPNKNLPSGMGGHTFGGGA